MGHMDQTLTASKIVMIDDQVSYAEAFGLALSLTNDLDLVARAPEAITGAELCLGLVPDLLVCDYRLPGGDTGVACAERLREDGFDKPVVILTGFPAPQVIREAAAIADVTVLSKDVSVVDLVAALRRVLAGRSASVDAPDSSKSPVKLSAGELEVLELLNQGVTAAEIAEQLHLSLHTIRARIKTLLKKLDATSQVEALATATRHGILVPPT